MTLILLDLRGGCTCAVTGGGGGGGGGFGESTDDAAVYQPQGVSGRGPSALHISNFLSSF